MVQLNDSDLKTLEKRGVTAEKLQEQLKMLRDGFPYLRIEGPATPGKGLNTLTPEMEKSSISIWDEYLAKGGKITKMVPASGAASRMFKNLLAFLNGNESKPKDDFMRTFFERIEDFAFFTTLNHGCMKRYGKSVNTLLDEHEYKDILHVLLDSDGMNYGSLPKALLEFHKIIGATRVALEEHLAEGAQYATGKDHVTRVHFTVSENHLTPVKNKIEEVVKLMEHRYGTTYEISFSIQKPSTDTIAATKDGKAFRRNGELFFRPGGHGALIENLNDIDSDVVFIKNIDNVVPDSLRESTNLYKKVIGGTLVGVKQRGDEYCRLIKKGKPTDEQIEEMLGFLRDALCITHDNADSMTREEKLDYIYGKLNRPYRVCGMVKNEGEPGGGPFLAYNPDGTVSPQILESTQIDPNNKEAQAMLRNSTHFNPVDLVVATKDWQGNRFHLPDYVDRATGFISEKSVDGIEIKALELPGLWNGSMSDWNTVLVEVPADTFNPVKTVNDLLRPVHQPQS